MWPYLPKKLGNFRISRIYFNNRFCYVLHRRKIRWESKVSPSHHIIRQIIANSPLMNLMVQSTHRLIGCNNGIDRYVNHIRFSRFNAVHLEGLVSEHKKYEFVAATLSDNPLEVVQINEMGPLIIGTENTGIAKVWLLICMEIVTR